MLRIQTRRREVSEEVEQLPVRPIPVNAPPMATTIFQLLAKARRHSSAAVPVTPARAHTNRRMRDEAAIDAELEAYELEDEEYEDLLDTTHLLAYWQVSMLNCIRKVIDPN